MNKLLLMIQTNTPTPHSPSALTEIATVVYVGIIVGIVFALIACCCCVRKCCCKKSSSKRDQPAAQSAAVYYHVSPSSSGYSDQLFIMCFAIFISISLLQLQDENQPAGPTYSAPAHSYQPANSLVLREPTTTSLGSSVGVIGVVVVVTHSSCRQLR